MVTGSSAAQRGSLVLGGLSDEEAVATYDKSLALAELKFDRLLMSEDQPVKYTKYVHELFSHLLTVRDALLRLAPGERGGLASAFGSSDEGCERVAKLLVLLTGGTEADEEPDGGIMRLQRGEGAEHRQLATSDRLDVTAGALNAYRSIAGVLDTISLNQAIQRMRERRKASHQMAFGIGQKLKHLSMAARRSVAERTAAEAEAAAAEAAAAEAAAAEAAGGEESPVANLLQRVDDAEVEDCQELLERIFARFDTNNDGVLDRDESTALLEEVVAYVIAENEKRHTRIFKTAMPEEHKATIRRFVYGPDGHFHLAEDGRITKEDLPALKKVVDDID